MSLSGCVRNHDGTHRHVKLDRGTARKWDSTIRAEVAALIDSGQARFCDLVRLELWNGARGAKGKRGLLDDEAAVDTLPTDTETWEAARKLARSARAAGITVPSSDILIVACARRHNAFLHHRDGHMTELEKLGE